MAIWNEGCIKLKFMIYNDPLLILVKVNWRSNLLDRLDQLYREFIYLLVTPSTLMSALIDKWNYRCF